MVISILIKVHSLNIKNQLVLIKKKFKKQYYLKKNSYENKDEFKYFIGYKSNDGIIPLYIKLPQVNAYDKHFDSNNKYMNLFVLDEELLKKIY